MFSKHLERLFGKRRVSACAFVSQVDPLRIKFTFTLSVHKNFVNAFVYKEQIFGILTKRVGEPFYSWERIEISEIESL